MTNINIHIKNKNTFSRKVSDVLTKLNCNTSLHMYSVKISVARTFLSGHEQI